MQKVVREAMGHKIQVFRKLKRITQVELAKELGYLSTGTLSQIENGVRGVDVEKMPKLAEILGVPLPILLSDIDISEEDAKLLVKLVNLMKDRGSSEKANAYYAAIKKILG